MRLLLLLLKRHEERLHLVLRLRLVCVLRLGRLKTVTDGARMRTRRCT